MIFTFVTGLAYPLAITIFAQVGFSKKANGSLIQVNNKVVGSQLVGQKFESDRYFWSRPSAVDYNPMPSGGTNLGPTSADLRAKVEERKKQGRVFDLLFSSASGLDPEISIPAAESQVERIAKVRHLTTQQVRVILEQNTRDRDFGILGERRVNVLRLNIALDQVANRK